MPTHTLATGKRAGRKKDKAHNVLTVHQRIRLAQNGAVCDWQSCEPSLLSQEFSAHA
jgi:hypothetical protein